MRIVRVTAEPTRRGGWALACLLLFAPAVRADLPSPRFGVTFRIVVRSRSNLSFAIRLAVFPGVGVRHATVSFAAGMGAVSWYDGIACPGVIL